MALGLAELAQQQGRDVALYPDWACHGGYDTVWDARVQRLARTNFQEWAYQQQCLIWLSSRTTRLWDVTSLPLDDPPRAQICVLDYTRLIHPEDLQHFDVVVAPSSALLSSMPGALREIPVTRLDWDPGGELVRKNRCYEEHCLSLYVPLQSAAAVRFGPQLFGVLQQVCRQLPTLRITVAYQRRWTRAALTALRTLVQASRGRVTVLRKPTRAQQQHCYRTHDWTFYPYYYDDVLLPALESLYQGTPVITFRSPIAAPIVIPGHNGQLLHCEHLPDAHGLPLRIAPDFATLQFELCETLREAAEWETLVNRPWPELLQRRNHFQEAWQTLWRGSY